MLKPQPAAGWQYRMQSGSTYTPRNQMRQMTKTAKKSMPSKSLLKYRHAIKNGVENSEKIMISTYGL